VPLGDGPARKPNSDGTTTLYRVTQQELQGEQTRIPIPTRQDQNSGGKPPEKSGRCPNGIRPPVGQDLTFTIRGPATRH
jgi:hypothetical protein